MTLFPRGLAVQLSLGDGSGERLRNEIVDVDQYYPAVRNDGIAGTGTASNPFDASTAAKYDQSAMRRWL